MLQAGPVGVVLPGGVAPVPLVHDQPGADGVHPHAEGAEVHRHLLHQQDQGPFGRLVDHAVGGCEEAVHRGDGDQRPAPAPLHVGHGVLGPQEVRGDHRGHGPVPVRQVQLEGRAALVPVGVVDQDVEAPEALRRPSDGGPDLLRCRSRPWPRRRPGRPSAVSSATVCSPFSCCTSATTTRAPLGEAVGDPPPDALRRSGDHRHFAFQTHRLAPIGSFLALASGPWAPGVPGVPSLAPRPGRL